MYTTGDPTRPVSVLNNGDKITVSQWTTTGTTGSMFTQSAYVDVKRNVDVRVLYDTVDVPSLIVDRNTGESIVIVPRDNRVDYLIYDRSGQYAAGIAVVRMGAKLYLARILSRPAFAGQLSAATDRLSFALLVDPSAGLGPLVEAPANFSAFFAANAGVAATASPTISVPDATASRARGAHTPIAIPSRFAADGVAAGLQRTLTKAGLILIGAGIAGAAFPALGFSTTLIPVALVAAGLGAIAIGNVPNFHVDAIDQFENAWGEFFEDGVSQDQSPQATMDAGYASVSSAGTLVSKGLGNLLTTVGDVAHDVVTSFMPSGAVPPTSGGPAVGASTVDGYAVDQGNTLYPINGSVTGTGQLSASGSAGSTNVALTGTITGNGFQGAYSGSVGSGSLSGSLAPLGNCQTQQQSGGQGTFAKAFNMGQSTGTVTFSYNAYAIPDAFQVATNGHLVFTTGGPVSYTGGQVFPLQGSPIVFVTVSAPLSGTAWDFALSCPA